MFKKEKNLYKFIFILLFSLSCLLLVKMRYFICSALSIFRPAVDFQSLFDRLFIRIVSLSQCDLWKNREKKNE